MSDWTVRSGYRYEPVEIVRETAAMLFYIDRSWTKERESRQSKNSFLPWRGTEDDARAIAAKLTSARAEYDRRRNAANEWFAQRRDEILSAYTVSA